VQLRHDCARNNVARRKFSHRVIALHESLAGSVAEIRAFSAQRLTQQKAWSSWGVQRRGMELDELDISDLRAGAPRASNSIASCDIRVRCVVKDTAQTARRKQDRTRFSDDHRLRTLIECADACDLAVVFQEVGDRREAFQRNVRLLLGTVSKRAYDLAASRVALRVQHAMAAMSALAREQQLAAFSIECSSPGDQLLDCSGTLLDKRAHGLNIAQPIAGEQRVLLMQLDFVVIAERDSDATLRILRRRLEQAVFCDDKNPAMRGQLNCRTKPCYTGSHHDEISAETLNWEGDDLMVQRDHMPVFEVRTGQHTYENVVQRGVLERVSDYLPVNAGTLFAITTKDVWRLHGDALRRQFSDRSLEVLLFPGGEENKRLCEVEALAEQMVVRGADRTSIVIGFGGGIVTDVSGFVAAIFMRGIPVVQIPTTLLAQVDAATGGKTGVNLVSGKNLIGSFHQPEAVLIDPNVLSTLPEREYRAGLFEVIKCGIIRDASLFKLLELRADAVLAKEEETVDRLITAAVRIKAEMVTADERESDLRRILNFGHTIGHAIEAETEYKSFLHGEAIAWGMLAATRLAVLRGMLAEDDAERIWRTVCRYGPVPCAAHLDPDRLIARLGRDKKTLKGKVHFVLPISIGEVKTVGGIPESDIRRAILEALQ
jgi:3-dehydroquinate synthase